MRGLWLLPLAALLAPGAARAICLPFDGEPSCAAGLPLGAELLAAAQASWACADNPHTDDDGVHWGGQPSDRLPAFALRHADAAVDTLESVARCERGPVLAHLAVKTLGLMGTARSRAALGRLWAFPANRSGRYSVAQAMARDPVLRATRADALWRELAAEAGEGPPLQRVLALALATSGDPEALALLSRWAGLTPSAGPQLERVRALAENPGKCVLREHVRLTLERRCVYACEPEEAFPLAGAPPVSDRRWVLRERSALFSLFTERSCARLVDKRDLWYRPSDKR
jgi:hypothetical protein